MKKSPYKKIPKWELDDLKSAQKRRLQRVKRALKNYAGEAGDDEADFRDLLTDMMHLAVETDRDFQLELLSATRHFNAETIELSTGRWIE